MDDTGSRAGRDLVAHRWGNRVPERCAEVVMERAAELSAETAEQVAYTMWDRLPARSRAMIASEDRAEARLAREQERARADAAEARRDQALAAYRSDAAMRGEVVSALDMATGQAGRTAGDVLGDAAAAGDRADGWFPDGKRPDAVFVGGREITRRDHGLPSTPVGDHFDQREDARAKFDQHDQALRDRVPSMGAGTRTTRGALEQERRAGYR